MKVQHPFYRQEDFNTFNDHWFKAIFNASRDGMAVELNEIIIYVNNAFLELYGYSDKEELIGQKISVIHAPEVDQMMLDFGKRRIQGEPVPSVYESKGKKKDGTIIDIEVTASVLTINQNTYIIDVNRNISERKNFERQLQEKNDQLEKMNSELDRFVYSASHDLRAPLRSLLGLIHLSKNNIRAENSLEYFNRMEKSIHSLDAFIQSILHYSRNSRLEVIPEEISVPELIESIIENLKYDKENEHVQLELNIQQECPFITDKYRLTIILNNLLSNAYRYKDSAKPVQLIRISVYINEHIAYISVWDNGCGILSDYLEKVFEMFFRGHKKSVGSGLGLYIAKESVKILKGNIYVESEYEKYTKFDVSIPNLWRG